MDDDMTIGKYPTLGVTQGDAPPPPPSFGKSRLCPCFLKEREPEREVFKLLFSFCSFFIEFLN